MQEGKAESINIDSGNYSIGIAQARFNQEITDRLLAGALSALKQSNVSEEHIFHKTVPGSAELPFLLDTFAKEGKCDALIALGCIIKGETDHHYYIATLATQGILKVTLRYHIPVGFGVLTVDTKEQAFVRSGADEHNVGFQAAMAALECAAKQSIQTQMSKSKCQIKSKAQNPNF